MVLGSVLLLVFALFRVVVEAFAAPPVRGGDLPRFGVLSLSVIFRVCLLFVVGLWCEFRAFGGKFSIPRGAGC